MHYSTLSANRILAGEFKDAAEWARKSLRLNTAYPPALRNLVVALAAMGEMRAAQSALAELMALDPTPTIASYKQSHPMFGRLRDIHAHWLRIAGLPEG